VPNASLRIAFLALACAAAPLAAQPAANQPSADEQRSIRTAWEQDFRRQKPVPTVPAALRQTVSATNEWVIVRMNDGSQHRYGIGALTVEDMESFQNGRFIGFQIFGNEEYGYILIDRAGRGEPATLHTGSKPSFAEDGRPFAAAEQSQSGFGNLSGVALWEVRPAGVQRIFYSDVLRGGIQWRAEPFRGPNCVPISAIDPDWNPATANWEEEAANAPRQWYELRWSAGDGIYFGHSTDAACYDDSSG